MKNKAFIIYIFITLLFFGMLIKLEYATDTYAVFNFDKEAVFMQYAMSGRFITGIFLKIFKMIKISEHATYFVSYILAVFCAIFSQFFLYIIIEKDIKNKVLKIIIPTLIIINPFSIELFLFIEKGFMWMGILACVLALINLQRYFIIKDVSQQSKGNKKYLLYSLTFMIVANCLYQGVVGIFLSIALVYILKYSKKWKEFITNNVIASMIYVLPALINYLIVKNRFKDNRLNGQIIFLKSIEKIWYNTIDMFKNMFGIFPKYTIILLILFTFMVFCSKIEKEKNKYLSIFKFFYIVIGITFVSIAPQLIQPTKSIWFGPRSTYSFASMYGVLIMFLTMNYKLEKSLTYIIVSLSIFLLAFQAQKFIKIERDRYLLNKYDKEISERISEQIKVYEEATGNKITELSWYEDEKTNYTYSGIFVTSDMNVKSYSSDWSTVEILKYYLKRNIRLEPKKEILEKEFKSKNWNEFNTKQILLEENKINICNY